MTCILQKNGKFKVVSFDDDHNHALVRTPMKHMLKVNRSMSEAQKAHADDAEKSGIPIKSTVDLMSREVGGPVNLGFLNVDYQNYINKKRNSDMEKGDAGAILQYFQKMHSNNSSYFSSMQLDEDDMITNIFWADARSMSDYSLFGDVVCFDTTYRTNEYGRPFAPFIGVNHHKQTVIFGGALMYDETTASMSGKQPKTILTDQSAAMAAAFSEIFPHSCHRLCVWHIYQNAAKNLSHIFHSSDEFANDFSKCVYDHEDEDEWLLAWNDMREKYNLNENDWLDDLFKVKEKWALVYGRHNFTADMKSTQRSESMNNVLKKYLKPSHNLLRFFEHYERVLEDRRYEELIADFKMIETTPVMARSVHMLHHGVEVYTPEIFKLFQEEYMSILDYNIYKVDKSGMISVYKVSYVGTPRDHLVKFEPSTETVTCSCMKFTFIGILCRHALKVLDKKNVKEIPSQYILKRWTREAKTRSITNYHEFEVHDNPKESMGKRYNNLCRNFREISSFAAEHEKLTEYAHQCSIGMLEGLEKIKKTLCGIESTSANRGKTTIGVNENIGTMIEPTNCATTIVRGVKTKPTVGRPRERLNGALERKRRNAPQKTKRAPARRKIAMEEFDFDGGTPQTSHGHETIQETQFTNETYANGANIQFSTHNIDVSSSWMTDVSFTQLLQESIVNLTAFSEDKETEK